MSFTNVEIFIQQVKQLYVQILLLTMLNIPIFKIKWDFSLWKKTHVHLVNVTFWKFSIFSFIPHWLQTLVFFPKRDQYLLHQYPLQDIPVLQENLGCASFLTNLVGSKPVFVLMPLREDFFLQACFIGHSINQKIIYGYKNLATRPHFNVLKLNWALNK